MDDIDRALERRARGEAKKPNDDYHLDRALREKSQRGSNYRAFVDGNRKSPN